MAAADYYLCDKCGGKCFYDASLNYEYPDKDGNDSWGNQIKDELVKGAGYKLDYLGDIAALCRECSETHEVIVRPKHPAA